MKKIYLTAGHQIINGKGNGAFGVDGFDEAYEARIVVQDLINHLKYVNNVPEKYIFTDHDSWGLRGVIDWLKKKVTRDCITIDVHFNAHSVSSATGTEVFIADNHTAEEKEIADILVSIMADSFGLRNRGVKTESQSARGKLGILSGGSAMAKNILLEICFCTNPYDVSRFRDLNRYLEFIEKTSDYIYMKLHDVV